MSDFSAIYHKKEGVIEIYNGKSLILEHIVKEKEDDWFGINTGDVEYDCNLYKDKLGLYECEKIEKNSYKTGEFINQIKMQIK